MDGNKKTIVYAFAVACIFGIIIVGALVLTSHTTDEVVTEIYFKDLDTLPSVVKIGDKIDFAFTLSHEKKQTAYNYRVTYDGNDISSGSFSREPSSFKTINVSMTPKNSSLVQMTDPVVSLSEMKYNVALGTIVGLLIFDPKLKESYNISLRTVIPEGGQEVTSPSDGQSLSNLGYTIRHDDWNIVNDRGNIDILHKNSSTIYRYAFKKVSVKVSSTGSEIRGAGESAKPAVGDTQTDSEYEIHFWIVVKEDPDKLQNIW